ncbi:YdcF family protein [Lysobacter arvi]|uniref:YdcF family protein n=1 Tax=Lysobacter arvi TaxID=3038776 RepID=A0ABU1C8R1_9GAMM|nr:YdcF family protein [Lysobacter arvi]MDR0181573.1 YdcF family protein [Lysobacter arvi]
MQALKSLLVALTYPPALTAALLIAAAVFALVRWRRLALGTAVFAIAWSCVLAVPSVSDWVRGRIERQYPPVDETTLPQADAIVVLGGATHFYWLERQNVTAYDLENSRLAAGARAWLAGKAPVIVLSGGGDNGGNEAASEARIMEHAIQRLGVPKNALLLETKSRNTRDNAHYTAQIAGERGFRRILLVTSSLHMPRAVIEFRRAGVDITPVPVPENGKRERWTQRWVPSRRALWRSGRAIKEMGAIVMSRLRN